MKASFISVVDAEPTVAEPTVAIGPDILWLESMLETGRLRVMVWGW